MKTTMTMTVVAALASAVVGQSSYCATPSDFTNSTILHGGCRITNQIDSSTNSTKQGLCNSFGYSVENNGEECKGNAMDQNVCENSVEGYWETSTCEQNYLYVRSMVSNMTNSQICGSHYYYNIQSIESTCCGQSGGADVCPPPPVCQSNSDFNASSVLRGSCRIASNICEQYGFNTDGDGDGGDPYCDSMPQYRCTQLGGVWHEFNCGEIRNYMAPRILSGNCSGEDGMSISLMENMCCNGNPGANTCPSRPIQPLCQVPSNFQPNGIVFGECRINSSPEASIDCDNNGGYSKEDDGNQLCDEISESTCTSMTNGSWVTRTCMDGYMYVNGGNFNCSESPEIPYLIEQHCCSGGAVHNDVCGPKVEFCNAPASNFNGSEIFMHQCKLCRQYPMGVFNASCNTQAMSNSCVSAGGWIMWEDNSFSCQGLNASMCSSISGDYDPVTCSAAQAHVSYSIGLEQLCGDGDLAQLTDLTPRCCTAGTARSICGAPGQVCETNSDFTPDQILWGQCKFCREFRFENHCGGDGGSSPRRRHVRSSSGPGSGSGFYNPNDFDCGNSFSPPIQDPVCANTESMAAHCILEGGQWDEMSDACVGLNRTQCNAISVGRWDPIFCRQAPGFIGQSQRSNNMTGRCADPEIRPKFEALGRCCGVSENAVDVCEEPTVPPNVVRSRIVLRISFPGNLARLTSNQFLLDNFKYQLKLAIVERSGGLITLDMIIEVILTQGGTATRMRRDSGIQADVKFNQTANVNQLLGAVQALNALNSQDPLSFDVNGTTYSAEAITSLSTVCDTPGACSASTVLPLPIVQLVAIGIAIIAAMM